MNRFLIALVLILITSVSKFYASNLIPKSSGSEDKFVIVLDAGHGGHDSGNRGNGHFEKDIALQIVLKIGKRLEKDKRFKVIYTRKTDKFVELYERGAIANRVSADLFVSIHCNAHHSQAYGTETFVLGLHANDRNFEVAKNENAVILLEDDYEANYDGFDPNSPESVIGLTLMQEEYLEQSLTLASIIQERFTKKLKKQNRGVKQAGFIVLHKTFMPSVLIETGFLTNTKEGKYLNSEKGQQEMAGSIFNSVIKYKEAIDKAFKDEKIEINEQDIVVEKKVKPEIITEQPVTTTTGGTGKTQIDGAFPNIPTKMTETTNTNEIVFKVQIAASSYALELTPENFKGLDGVDRMKVGTLYKYYYGKTSDYSAIKLSKQRAKDIGFPSCFVVAFKADNIIPLSQALRSMSISNDNK